MVLEKKFFVIKKMQNLLLVVYMCEVVWFVVFWIVELLLKFYEYLKYKYDYYYIDLFFEQFKEYYKVNWLEIQEKDDFSFFDK